MLHYPTGFDWETSSGNSTVLVAMPWWLWAAVCCHIQNPWAETNPPLFKTKGVKLARRQSWGGAVYHVGTIIIGSDLQLVCAWGCQQTLGGEACGQQQIWHHMYQHWKVSMLTTAAYDGRHSASIKLTKIFSSWSVISAFLLDKNTIYRIADKFGKHYIWWISQKM